MTEWYFGNSSGPRDWEKKNRNPYGFNPYSPYNWRKSLKHYVDTLEKFLNHEDVKNKIAKGERVAGKGKGGDKIYRMTIEDITLIPRTIRLLLSLKIVPLTSTQIIPSE